MKLWGDIIIDEYIEMKSANMNLELQHYVMKKCVQ